MEKPNPATPAQAATPGNVPQGSGTPSPVTPAAVTPTGQGNQAEGTVTIPTKEYAQLQRDHARVVGFEKRASFARSRPASANPNGEGSDDPEVLERLRTEQEARAESDRRAYRAEVTLKVRDLLEKDDFKNLPASTKALILKNPAMLSEADNVDEALLDIEDFVREQVAGMAIPVQGTQPSGQGGGTRPSASPTGHDTPPVVGGGSPAPVTGVEMEDVSKLTGPARSRAILRNSLKKAGKGAQ